MYLKIHIQYFMRKLIKKTFEHLDLVIQEIANLRVLHIFLARSSCNSAFIYTLNRYLSVNDLKHRAHFFLSASIWVYPGKAQINYIYWMKCYEDLHLDKSLIYNLKYVYSRGRICDKLWNKLFNLETDNDGCVTNYVKCIWSQRS